MKLFIVASLIAVASAGRLEHLERSYLPPTQGSGAGQFGSSPSSFGGSSAGFGGHGGFGSSSFDSNAIETPSAGVRSSGSFPGATINQYLPPDHGPSGSNGAFTGSLQGFGRQGSQYSPQSSFGRSSQQYSSPSSQYGSPAFGGSSQHSSLGSQYSSPSSQYSSPSSQYSSPSSQYSSPSSQYSAPSSQYGAPSSFGAQSRYQGSQGSSQFPATSRQYLAPSQSSSNYPQQAFDEQTGYQY